jgi:tetratricopeptide (TPR) repeat protein
LRREAGDLTGAEASLRRVLELPEGDHFASVDAGVRSYKARQNLGVVYRDLGRHADAEAEWRKVVAERPDFLPGWQALGELMLAQRRWEDLEAVACAISDTGSAADAAALRALGHLARREFEQARVLLEAAIVAAPDALAPRVVLSHVLLQEGRDPAAAERTLLGILERAPNHAEARKNLAMLRRDRERTRVAADTVFSGNVGVSELYFSACRSDHPIREHLPHLVVLARTCAHITDVGTGLGLAAAAFLYAEPRRLLCMDRVKYPEVDRLRLVAGRTEFTFRQTDVLWEELEETDLLFLDTWHVSGQLAQELQLHAGRAGKYIVIHGTTLFGEQGEDAGHGGLWSAVETFLTQGTFRLKERRTEGIGLTVLERINEPSVTLNRTNGDSR